jgi:hypothetical protein
MRLRLGFGIYVRLPLFSFTLSLTDVPLSSQIFDMLVASLLDLQPVISIAEIAETIYLPDDTFTPRLEGRRRFRGVLAVLLTEGRVEGFLTPLSTAIIQLTLFRLCIDASYIQKMLSSAVSVKRTGTYRLLFSSDLKQCALTFAFLFGYIPTSLSPDAIPSSVQSLPPSSIPALTAPSTETLKNSSTASAPPASPPSPPSLLSTSKPPPSPTTPPSPSPATISFHSLRPPLGSMGTRGRWSRGRRSGGWQRRMRWRSGGCW